MFTGLVQRTGRLFRSTRPNGGALLRIETPEPWPDGPLSPGESVAVQGVCLTVASAGAGGGFSADVLEETLVCSAFRSMPDGALVNLERALRVGDRLGGHLVQGHVDGLGRVASLRPRKEDVVLRVAVEPPLLAGIVLKGSIAIDGVSLTVSALSDADGWFEVNLIPTTLRETSLSERRPGDVVNLETDVLGKYVARVLASSGRGNAPAAGPRVGTPLSPEAALYLAGA